jgi:hypothetical protein
MLLVHDAQYKTVLICTFQYRVLWIGWAGGGEGGLTGTCRRHLTMARARSSSRQGLVRMMPGITCAHIEAHTRTHVRDWDHLHTYTLSRAHRGLSPCCAATRHGLWRTLQTGAGPGHTHLVCRRRPRPYPHTGAGPGLPLWGRGGAAHARAWCAWHGVYASPQRGRGSCIARLSCLTCAA